MMWLQIGQGLSEAGAACGGDAGEVEVEGVGTTRVEEGQHGAGCGNEQSAAAVGVYRGHIVELRETTRYRHDHLTI